MARLIDVEEFIKEINNRCESAIKWGTNAIADHNEEIRIRAEQAVATFCEASLTAKKMPTIDAVEVVRCKDCRWFDKTEDSSYGYCHAMKHAYLSKNWEISIYRTYKEDFYCADGEKNDETN